MDLKNILIMSVLGIGALAFLLMPKKVEQHLLTTEKGHYATGSNGKYQIEADGSVMAASLGIKGQAYAPTPKPSPTPTPTPPVPRKPILPWRAEEAPDGQVEGPKAPTIDVEALKTVLKPQAPTQTQGSCANGQCQPARRRWFR
jgi:hypothetical protein